MESSDLRISGAYLDGLRGRIARPTVIILLAISITFPAAFMPLKAGIWILVLLVEFSGMVSGQLPLSRRLYFFSFFYVLIGITWSFYGAMRGDLGATSVMTVMVLYPALIPLSAALYKKEDNLSLYRLFLVCAWIIAVTDIIYVLAYSTHVGHILHGFFDSIYANNINTVVISNDSAIKFNLMNIASVIFLLPFFISALLFPESSKKHVHIFVVVLALLAVGILSGRRALLVTMLMGPTIAFIITYNRSKSQSKPKSTRRRWIPITIGVMFVSIWVYLAVDFVGIKYYVDVITSILNFTDNRSNLERLYQYNSLKSGILDAPLVGYGAGAVAHYVRSTTWPWLYELYYLAFIFQYGIIGFSIYALGVAFLCLELLRAVKKKGRSSFEYYLLSGFIAFMLANATNPYLPSFDFMWVIFIPYAIVNRRLCPGRHDKSIVQLLYVRDDESSQE